MFNKLFNRPIFGSNKNEEHIYTEKEYDVEVKFSERMEELLKCFALMFEYQSRAEKEDKNKNSWHYIQNHKYRDFLTTLDKVKLLLESNRKRKDYRWEPKFLDAGCGIGLMIKLANSLDFEAYGLEIQDSTFKIAKKLNYNVIQTDILKYKNYRKYDVIYFYCPFSNDKTENEFEKIVANGAKVGAYIIPWGCGEGFNRDKRFKIIYYQEQRIFQKIKS